MNWIKCMLRYFWSLVARTSRDFVQKMWSLCQCHLWPTLRDKCELVWTFGNFCMHMCRRQGTSRGIKASWSNNFSLNKRIGQSAAQQLEKLSAKVAGAKHFCSFTGLHSNAAHSQHRDRNCAFQPRYLDNPQMSTQNNNCALTQATEPGLEIVYSWQLIICRW